MRLLEEIDREIAIGIDRDRDVVLTWTEMQRSLWGSYEIGFISHVLRAWSEIHTILYKYNQQSRER